MLTKSDPPEPEPTRQYACTRILLPPTTSRGGALETMAWAYDRRHTITFSADDAGVRGPEISQLRIYVIRPQDWEEDIFAFFDEHYPGAELIPVEPDENEPSELRLTYPTTRMPPAITSPFGEDRGSYTHMGLDLRSSWGVWGDEILAALGGEIIFVGEHPRETDYGWQIKTMTTLADGRKVRIRYAHFVEGGIYVEGGDTVVAGDKLGQPGGTGNSSGDHLHIDVQIDGEYVNPEPLIEFPDNEPPEPSFPIRGVHDVAGGHWLAQNGLQGWCTIPVYLGTDSRRLDEIAYLAENDIRVILNLRYSWAVDDGGQGTLPAPDELGAFEAAAVETMKRNPEAWGFVYCNEMNNQREWARNHALTTGYYAQSYNRIWSAAPECRLAPGAIDGYNPGWGDWRGSWHKVLELLLGADFLALHAYDHGLNADPNQVFGHAPLQGVYFNLRNLESQIEVLPDRFAHLPIVITETNHGADGSHWSDESRPWVKKAMDYSRGVGVEGVCLFRFNYDNDRWRFGDHRGVLEALGGDNNGFDS